MGFSSAEDLAIKTNTNILVSIDGQDVELSADDLIKLHDKEAQQSNQWAKQKPPEGGLLDDLLGQQ